MPKDIVITPQFDEGTILYRQVDNKYRVYLICGVEIKASRNITGGIELRYPEDRHPKDEIFKIIINYTLIDENGSLTWEGEENIKQYYLMSRESMIEEALSKIKKIQENARLRNSLLEGEAPTISGQDDSGSI